MLGYLLDNTVLQSCLFGLVIGLVVFWYVRRRRYKLPPGPMGLPLIGNLHQFKDPMLHEQFYKWSKKYGPVISVYIGPALNVVVNDLETANEVLIKKGAEFASRVSNPSIDIITQGGKDIVLAPYGPTWKMHRKLASKALRFYMQGAKLEERIHNSLEYALPQLVKDGQHGAFDPEEHINIIVINILMGLCFAGKYEYDDPEIRQVMKIDDDFIDYFMTVCPEDVFPCLQYVYKSAKIRQIENLTNGALGFLERKYREHEKTFDRGNVRDFCDMLIRARVEAEEEGEEDVDKLTDTHIIQTLADIFFAGIDTTRMTLRYAVLHMCAYPDIQAKVHQELDTVVGRDRLPGMSDRPDLPYTEAVLHESMRLSTVAPTGVPHMSTCDSTIAGYDVPKNTQVIINQWALHHSPDAWDDVNVFIPERYLDKNGKLGPKPDNWLPFSAGRRVCLGESVAKPELHLIFASLMQRFNWSTEEGVTVDLTPNGSMFALIPKPYKVIIKERL